MRGIGKNVSLFMLYSDIRPFMSFFTLAIEIDVNRQFSEVQSYRLVEASTRCKTSFSEQRRLVGG